MRERDGIRVMRLRTFGFYVFHWALFSISLLLTFSPFIAHAQQGLATRDLVEENRSRINMLEYKIEDFGTVKNAVQSLERRMIIMETLLDTGAFWNKLATSGVGLVLAREVLGVLKSRRASQ